MTIDGIHPAAGTTSTDRAHTIHPPVTNAPGKRSRIQYDQVIDQFAVSHNPRYSPGGGATYCNIFAWDVTRAMGCEIPHWILENGKPAAAGAPGADEININQGLRWMLSHGRAYGWTESNAGAAQAAANEGEPAVVMWRNPAGHGHVAVIRPGTLTDGGPCTAQAGGRCFNHGTVHDSFHGRGPLRYFVHK